MRGKGDVYTDSSDSSRITPAYAGKSFLHPRRRHTQKDHPRLCGEKGTFADALNWAQGSPPPMRGKADDGSTGNPKGRITPAYAGKS